MSSPMSLDEYVRDWEGIALYVNWVRLWSNLTRGVSLLGASPQPTLWGKIHAHYPPKLLYLYADCCVKDEGLEILNIHIFAGVLIYWRLARVITFQPRATKRTTECLPCHDVVAFHFHSMQRLLRSTFQAKVTYKSTSCSQRTRFHAGPRDVLIFGDWGKEISCDHYKGDTPWRR